MTNKELLSWCFRCHRKFEEMGEVLKWGKHYDACRVKHIDGTQENLPESMEIIEAICKNCMVEVNTQKYDKEKTMSLTDEVMPRAGICNKCTQSLAGMEHCRGKEMGCNCDCKCKHLEVYWEMHKERADRKRLDTGTCIKCGEQVRKVTNI